MSECDRIVRGVKCWWAYAGWVDQPFHLYAGSDSLCGLPRPGALNGWSKGHAIAKCDLCHKLVESIDAGNSDFCTVSKAASTIRTLGHDDSHLILITVDHSSRQVIEAVLALADAGAK